MHIPRKHKNEHNRQKIGEMPKSIMSKLWSIINSSLPEPNVPDKDDFNYYNCITVICTIISITN